MQTIFLYLLLVTFGAITLTLVQRESSVYEFAINILASISFVILEKIFQNFRYIWLWIITHTYYRNKRIRLSISYLFKIRISGKYLLVRSQRIPNQFQPVGGVFKRYRESYFALENLEVTDDENVPLDDTSMGDLRIKIPATNIISFLKWYNSQLGREVSPFREFYEELIRPGVLDQKTFPYVNYIHRKRHQTKIRFSYHFKCHEILIAEIFELIPNEEQMFRLKETQSNTNDLYAWVSAESIERLGAIPGGKAEYVISETSQWVL